MIPNILQALKLVILLCCVASCTAAKEKTEHEAALAKCYHRVLGIQASVSDLKTIKQAYRHRAKTMHPDKNKGSNEAFHLLNEAYNFMIVASNRRRLRKFLKTEKNQKICGWRFDYQMAGAVLDTMGSWSWWLMKGSWDAGRQAAKYMLAGPSDHHTDNRSQTNAVNIVYLDNSGSMSGFFSSWFGIAHPLFRDMAATWQGIETRVVLFGTGAEVIIQKTKRFDAEKVIRGWSGNAGGTYMWHMIQEDVLATEKPGNCRLRVFVITDGDDNRSPWEYLGVGGMDPMMSTLIKAGYDIEFHIVVLGVGSLDASSRYRDLARATGGNFLYIDWLESDDSTNTAIEVFVKQIKAYAANADVKETEAMRLEQKKKYELDVKKGEATNFEWYKQLPGN